METTATIFAIIFVWNVYEYMQGNGRCYYFALVSYILCVLSHERYIVLMPVLLYAWWVTDKKKDVTSLSRKIYLKPVLTILLFGLIMLLEKCLTLNIMMGTGGTNVVETFSVKILLIQIIYSIGYLLGFNGPQLYLSMISWYQYSWKAKIVVLVSILMIAILVILSIIDISKSDKEDKRKNCSVIVMFLLVISAVIFVSSITIRVELRWMYYPYMAMVFLLIYLAHIKRDLRNFRIKQFCFFMYMICTIAFNIYCRRYYGNLYYWRIYTMANSLSDNTYGRYGNKMYKKSWVLITQMELEIGSYDDLMRQFDISDQYDIKLEVIPTIKELDNVDDIMNKEILYFDKKQSKFINISKVVRQYLAE